MSLWLFGITNSSFLCFVTIACSFYLIPMLRRMYRGISVSSFIFEFTVENQCSHAYHIRTIHYIGNTRLIRGSECMCYPHRTSTPFPLPNTDSIYNFKQTKESSGRLNTVVVGFSLNTQENTQVVLIIHSFLSIKFL